MVNFDDGIHLLKRHFVVDAVWLFGSQARGEANDASDVDLAAHVTSAEGYGLADTIAGEFTLLEKN